MGDRDLPPGDEMSATARANNLTYSPSSQGSDEVNDVPPPPPQQPSNPKEPLPKNSSELPRPAALNMRHQRKISWGGNEILHLEKPAALGARQRSEASYSSALFNPVATSSPGTLEQRLSIGGHTGSPNPSSTSPRSNRNSARATVIEVPSNLGVSTTMESEAEACLLRALEKSLPDTEPPLLPHLPDEAMAHTAQMDEQEDAPSLTRNSIASTTRGNISQKSHATVQSTRTPPPPRHSRKHTLDQQLAGLSNAIEILNANNNALLPGFNNDTGPNSPGPRSRTNTLESVQASSTISFDTKEDAMPPSSYDTLAQNAELFYQQQQQDPDASRGFLSSFLRGNKDDLVIMEDEPAELLENDELTDIESPPSLGQQHITEGGNGADSSKIDPNRKSGQAHSITASSSDPSSWSKRVRHILFDEWVIVGDMIHFMRPKRNLIVMFLQIVVVYIGIPSLGVAAILFYFAGNPPSGRYEILDGNSTSIQEPYPTDTSFSYYLLFFGVRQMTTLTLAMATQLILIDFLALDRGYLFRFGARLPLFIMQARGWPFVLFFWCMYDWALLSGKHPFFAHWLYFQNAIDLFNEGNPDGGLVSSSRNDTILGIATGLSLAVAIKRFWMGIFLGKKTYHQYSDKLADAMKRMLLTAQVAALSRQIVTSQGRTQLQMRENIIFNALTEEKINGMMHVAADDMSDTNADESVSNTAGGSLSRDGLVIDPADRSPLTGKLSQHQKNRIVRLLGEWEEPSVLIQLEGPVSIASLMHFRRGIRNLRTDFPFSASFGPAGTREDCITSAQEVFRRLMFLSDFDDVLNFEVLALLGAKSDGTLDQDKLIELIRLFRPDRDGSLSMVNFVRSVDNVYKEIRMLRASVSNSSKVDRQFEMIFDIIFYIVACVVILYILGIDPLSLFVSLSGLAVSISFSKYIEVHEQRESQCHATNLSTLSTLDVPVIGTASAKYFQGLLFILLRRPYSIGDYIHVSDPTKDTDFNGSGCWIVEDITLYHTTARFLFTNERATLSNGAMADFRVINASRSPNAVLIHKMKMPISVSNEKLEIFKSALERFVLNRPREWVRLVSIRVTDVDPSAGFLQLIIVAMHRDVCANWSHIKTSQSDLIRFGVELAKKLDIVFEQPVLPVDVRMPPGMGIEQVSEPGAATGLPAKATGRSPRETIGHKPSYSMDFQSIEAQFPQRVTA
eukprot:Nitzschia sp. Nitz4//scaffold126_size65214//36226//39877//NITZ4_006159-RA/size65214-processed-gene-0.40-mRNA-1//-1//CDS//3329534698//767//frame0